MGYELSLRLKDCFKPSLEWYHSKNIPYQMQGWNIPFDKGFFEEVVNHIRTTSFKVNETDMNCPYQVAIFFQYERPNSSNDLQKVIYHNLVFVVYDDKVKQLDSYKDLNEMGIFSVLDWNFTTTTFSLYYFESS